MHYAANLLLCYSYLFKSLFIVDIYNGLKILINIDQQKQ